MPGGYTGITQIEDPRLRQLLTTLMHRVGALETRVAALEAAQPLAQQGQTPARAFDVQGGRVATVGDPTDESDAVNLRTLRAYVDQAIAAATAP